MQSFPSKTVAIPRLKSLVCSTNLSIAGGRIVKCILFLRVLALCEMQTTLFRIWTQVVKSIFYDDIHYATSASMVSIKVQIVWNKTCLYHSYQDTPVLWVVFENSTNLQLSVGSCIWRGLCFMNWCIQDKD